MMNLLISGNIHTLSETFQSANIVQASMLNAEVRNTWREEVSRGVRHCQGTGPEAATTLISSGRHVPGIAPKREGVGSRTMINLTALLWALGIGGARSMILVAIFCLRLVGPVGLCALRGLGFFVHHSSEVPNANVLLVAIPIGSWGYAEHQTERLVICPRAVAASCCMFRLGRSTISPKGNAAYWAAVVAM